MANSPVNYSPILRRLRANSGYKGPSAAKEDVLTSPLSSSGSRSSSVSEDDSRWRPRSFDSFFQESTTAQNGALLDDFDHLRPFHNKSGDDSSSSSSSPSSTARHTVLSESAPTHRTRSPHGERVSSSSPSPSAASSPSSSSTLSPSAKLAPRQLFDQQQQQLHQHHHHQQQEATSPNTSDSDSNEANLFNSYNAYTNAYTSPLSFSASSVPVRARAEASLGSRLAGSMAGAVAHAIAAANRPSPPRSASVDLGTHFIPLAKSFSDGEIEVKFTHERGSSQSPLRLLAARNNLETPTNSPPREAAQMVALTSSDDVDQLADYDSEMGSSDYESEEEGPMVGGVQGLAGDASRRASVSAASGANFMRKRVLWQRSRSLSGKSSGYQAFRSSMKSSAGSSARSSSSSSGLRWVGLWLYLLLAIEVASLFYVGYTLRLSYSAISLNEFGGFMERYPQADEAHVGWKENPLNTCQKYLGWLQVSLSETRSTSQRGQTDYVPPVHKPRQPWYRLKKTHRHRVSR